MHRLHLRTRRDRRADSPVSTGESGSFRRSFRGAFTLVELLLVLALLVILAAMVAPSFDKPYENYKLRKGGEQVRTLFAKAQMRAMRSGQIQVLVFVPGSDLVQIQTFTTGADSIEATATSTIIGAPTGGVGAVGGTMLGPLNDRLPDGIVFAQAITNGDMRDQLAQQDHAMGTMGLGTAPTAAPMPSTTGLASSLENTDLLQQGGIPLMFYPDGTSSTARVVLANEKDAYIAMDLRGLTGVATVSNLLTMVELQEY